MRLLAAVEKLDRRVLYVLMVFAVGIPLLLPVGLPLEVVKETRDCYNAVEGLKPQDIVVLSADISSANTPEMNPMVEAIFAHAMSKNVRVVILGLVAEGPQIVHPLVGRIALSAGKKYGVDWVNLGYKPGGQITLKRMVDDVWEASANVDIDGTDLAQLPVMKDLKSFKQASLFVDIASVSPGMQNYLTFVSIPTGIPMTGGVTSVAVNEEMPYVRSGQYKGLLMGLRGAAEYELLIGKPGKAASGMDAQSFAHLLVVVFVILGNAGHAMRRKTVRQKA